MSELPESPTSVTYSVTSKNGFNTLVTIRDAEFKELSVKMQFVEEWFTSNGYTPQVKQSFGAKPKDYVEGRVCPKDGGKLVNKVSKTGMKYIACENGKYNPTTKSTDGCSYVEFPERKA